MGNVPFLMPLVSIFRN